MRSLPYYLIILLSTYRNIILFSIDFSYVVFIVFAIHFITVTMDTLKMLYKSAGEKLTGGNAPLILLPGGLTGWISWDPFVPHFSSSRKVIQAQLLNVQYGIENIELPKDYSVGMESRALAASLKEAGAREPSDFIGWSYGAMVLLDFALNNPNLVKTLVLIEPPAFWILKAHNCINTEIKQEMEFLYTLHGDISEAQLEGFLIAAGFARPGSSVREHPKWEAWKPFRNSLKNSRAVIDHTGELNKLKNFKPPVLLVKGTGSSFFLHEIIRLLGEDLPVSKTVEFPEGHAPHIVSTNNFLEEVNLFHEKHNAIYRP
jgi:pimeloyl-ACP methyl ester carboxylesterase